jgi:hypothetical protein
MAIDRTNYTALVDDDSSNTVGSQWNKTAIKDVILDPIDTALSNAICQGRITLTTVVPVTVSDVTAATTVRFTPFRGNKIGLYDGSTTWKVRTFSELSLSLGSDAANTPYDLFCYDNSGTPALERLAWTNDTTRATALVLQDGILVKTGATTRRYVGTYRTTGTVGQTEDSFANRLVWNYYNRVRRGLRVTEATSSWAYTLATFRQARATTTNQVAVVVGVAEALLSLRVRANVANTSGGVNVAVGIGEDSTSTVATGCLMQMVAAGANIIAAASAELEKYPAVGYHFYPWLEYSTATGTTNWQGNAGVSYVQSGIHGSIEG